MRVELIWQPLINLLIIFYRISFNNLGLGVILFTGFLTLLMFPITSPLMRNMQKMRDLAPELERIKRRYKNDKKKQMQAQADFYREKGVNPAAGCLPQIIQLVVLFALFRGFINVFTTTDGITDRLNEVLYPGLELHESVNVGFLGRDVTKPDVLNVSGLPFALPGVFLLLAALAQFFSSRMMTPNVQQSQKIAKKTEGGFDDVATSMQKQMLYFFPLLTIFIGYSFPLILVLYWGSLSVFQGIQRYAITSGLSVDSFVARLNLVQCRADGKEKGSKSH